MSLFIFTLYLHITCHYLFFLPIHCDHLFHCPFLYYSPFPSLFYVFLVRIFRHYHVFFTFPLAVYYFLSPKYSPLFYITCLSSCRYLFHLPLILYFSLFPFAIYCFSCWNICLSSYRYLILFTINFVFFTAILYFLLSVLARIFAVMSLPLYHFPLAAILFFLPFFSPFIIFLPLFLT